MSRTILLADDSVTIQKVVELTFMDEDYTVVAVSNGDDALKAIGEMNPDLVITDLHMPGAGGLEVCRRAKEASLPVLLLVGTFEPFQQSEADEAGVDGVVRKPFDSQELLQRVADLMAGGEAASETDGAGAAEVAEASAGFEIEASPWDKAEESGGEVVEFAQAEGLISTDTTGATTDHQGATEATEVDESSATRTLSIEDMQSAAAADDAAGEPAPAVPSPISERFAVISGGEPEGTNGHGEATLSVEDVDRVARRVAELLGETMLREVAWEVVPDLAEVVIKERIRELERQLE